MTTVEQNVGNGVSTIQVTHRLERSLPMFLLHKVLRPLRNRLLHAPDPVSGESQQITIPRSAKRDCDIVERRVNDIYVYDFTAKKAATHLANTEKPRKKRVYYFAGGGWQMPPSEQHIFLCSALATRMPFTVLSLISYPLAPDAPAPKSFPQICDLFRVLTDEAEKADETVIMAGDSAGGNISLCLPLYMLAQDPQGPAPAAIMAISPSTDLRRSNPAIEKTAKHDPLLTPEFIKSTADRWRGEWDAYDPRISPLAADLKVLAERNIQVHGVTGGYDILSPDGILFREKLAKAGVKGQWLEWDKQMHVWVLTGKYGLPESRKAIDWIAGVMNSV